MPIACVCPNCRHAFDVPDAKAGRIIGCPNCRHGVTVPHVTATVTLSPSKPAPSASFQAAATTPVRSTGPMEVVVVDFRMSFRSMVGFMVKWVIAAIPAMIILFFLSLAATVAFYAFVHLMFGPKP